MPKYVSEDGRAFTTYLPNCELNGMLQKKYGTKTSHELRYFLQNNSDKVREDLMGIGSGETDLCPVCKAALAYKPQGETQ